MHVSFFTFNKELINRRLLLILAFMPAITLVLASNSAFMRISLIIELGLLLILYFTNYKRVSKIGMCIILINAFSLTITLGIHSALGNAIMYINAILCFKVFNNIVIDKNTFFLMHLVNALTLSIYVFMIKRPRYSGNTVIDAFGNNINTNMISILFLCAFLHLVFCILLLFEKKIIRFPAIIIASIIYGENIWFFEARSAIISMLAFIIAIMLIKDSISYSNYKKIIVIVLILSLLFPFIYLYTLKTLHISEFMGKGISTRSIVWESCINVIKDEPIFGNGNDTLVVINNSGRLTPSMHNTLLSLWKILGVIPTITFVVMFIQHDSFKFDNKKYLFAQIAIISTLPVCFFESFYTEELLYMSFLQFLITNIKSSENKKEGVGNENNSLLLVWKKS